MKDTARSFSPVLRDYRVVEVDPVQRATTLDPHALSRLFRRERPARQRGAHGLSLSSQAQKVDAAVGSDRARVDSVEDDRPVGVLGGRKLARPDDVVNVGADRVKRPRSSVRF